jgi:hypothetical protein
VSAKFVPKLQLHHGNAPAHYSLVIQGFLAKHKIPLISQAPYSPDFLAVAQTQNAAERYPI